MSSEDERIAAWWDGLGGNQRAQVRAHLEGDLPGEVAAELLRARVTVTGAVGRGGATYKLPGTVVHFVQGRTD